MTWSLVAPLTGWATALAELPDAAFAQGLAGDGVAIDPLDGELRAPCAGTVVALHRARHAVSLRTEDGLDILCHIGIDTVALEGRGFTADVGVGDRVAAGQRLIGFDLDTLAAGARSLASPILVVDADRFRIVRRTTDRRVAAGDWLMDVEPVAATVATAAAPASNETACREVVIPPGHGIHARPAAAIATQARRFAAAVTIASDRAGAPADSAIGLMTLGLAAGERATIRGEGADAAAAVDALAELIARGFDEPGTPDTAPRSPARPVGGVTAVPGVAIGTAVRLDTLRVEPASEHRSVAEEIHLLDQAIARVRAAIADRAGAGSAAQRGIATAHLTLLDDPRLRDAAGAAIASGAGAGTAWRAALAPDIAALRAVADPRIAGRADDLLDLERQVIAATLGDAAPAILLPPDAIIVADDLLPSQLMALDAGRVAGIALGGGGPTSHVAIMAAARATPMAVALGVAATSITAGARVILDADAATIVPADTDREREAASRLAAAATARAAALADARTPCRMADGARIEVFANLGSLADADAAMAAGAEGCGLLRTELLFLDRDTPPGEAEQRDLYAAIAARLEGRPLVIRTLDVGGDKPVRYLPIGPEENPALGLRGIRVGLDRPDLLDTQLRAILSAASSGQCRILVPMVASLAELQQVRQRAERLARDLDLSGPVAVGVMIETPAAAISADLLAPAADFFSVGTNDLSQYTLAMDRGNPAVAGDVDALHPAVLRMIEAASRAAASHGRPVAVCGGLASDPAAAAILIGLGVTELSAVPAVIPELKQRVRTLTLTRCEALAAAAVALPSAAAVRALVADAA